MKSLIPPGLLIALLALSSLIGPLLAGAEILPTLTDECKKVIHKGDSTAEERQRCMAEYRARTVDILITANRVPEHLAAVPASVAVIDSKAIERSHGGSVADILRDVPGVEVSDAGEPGLKRIRIRGEDSKRVSILIDGQEFFDARDVGTPILIAPEFIERIEVLRGPAAVQYGSRAVGGVVNIITKKGGYHPLQAAISGQADSSNSGGQGSAAVFGTFGGFEYRASVAGATAEDRQSAEEEIDPSDYSNKSSLLYLARQLGDHRLAANYQMFDGRSDVYVQPEVRTAPPFMDFQLSAPQRDRERYSLFYDYEPLEGVIRLIHADVFLQSSARKLITFSTTAAGPSTLVDTTVSTYGLTDSYGANLFGNFEVSRSLEVLLGGQVSSDDLDQERERISGPQGTASPRRELTTDAAELKSQALYSRLQWQMAKDWEVAVGGRLLSTESTLESTTRVGLTPSDADDTAAVGSASVLYSGMEDTSLWFKAAQGYQFPALNQSATGAFAGPSFVSPNPDLEPEESWELELGGRYDSDALSAQISIFYAEAQNYIDTILCSTDAAPCVSPTALRDRVYVNVDEALTFGGEAELRYQIGGIAPYVRGAYLRRRLENNGASTYSSGVPVLSGRIGLQYEREFSPEASLWSDLYLVTESETKELDGIATVRNPGWGTLNLAVGFDLGEARHHHVSFELANILDKSYTPGTESTPASGAAAIVRFATQF